MNKQVNITKVTNNKCIKLAQLQIRQTFVSEMRYKRANHYKLWGLFNAYTALMASEIRHTAVYISDDACANASYGLAGLLA